MERKRNKSYPCHLFRIRAVNDESLRRWWQFSEFVIERQQSDIHSVGGPGLRFRDPFVGQRGPVGRRYLRFPFRSVPNGISCGKKNIMLQLIRKRGFYCRLRS